MVDSNNLHEKILQISKVTGIPTKKVLDIIFHLRGGNPIENNELLQRLGVSKNALNQAKELLSFLLEPPSKNTQLTNGALSEVQDLFDTEYHPEEALWAFFENEGYKRTLALLEKYRDKRAVPERKYDQFTATIETSARRASLLDYFEDIEGKRILFLGDDDLTSVAVASYHQAAEITALDIDKRVLDSIDSVSKSEKLDVNLDNYDARRTLPLVYCSKFDIVFTDPPYITDGIKLFVSRAVQALYLSNQTARIYVCYGNSDRAKEKFMPIYEVFGASGLMVRWVFDKFNRYNGAESIGSASSLFVLDVTSKTKSIITGDYDRQIYTKN